MREYEIVAVYSLAVAEAEGPEAAVTRLKDAVEARGGTVLRVDHWGRRRMAYPINKAIDGDYVVMRAELAPDAVNLLETALRIDERVYRHLVVRADELPAPPQPREPRRRPEEAAADSPLPGPAPEAAPAGAAAPADGEAVPADGAPAPVATTAQ
jgi:small subunit ribosomal protein S6